MQFSVYTIFDVSMYSFLAGFTALMILIVVMAIWMIYKEKRFARLVRIYKQKVRADPSPDDILRLRIAYSHFSYSEIVEILTGTYLEVEGE